MVTLYPAHFNPIQGDLPKLLLRVNMTPHAVSTGTLEKKFFKNTERRFKHPLKYRKHRIIIKYFLKNICLYYGNSLLFNIK